MKLLAFIALFALIFTVVSGHGCAGPKPKPKAHAEDHHDNDGEMKCPDGEVAVEGYGNTMKCVGWYVGSLNFIYWLLLLFNSFFKLNELNTALMSQINLN